MLILYAVSTLFFLRPVLAIPTTGLLPTIQIGSSNSLPSSISLSFNLFGSQIPSLAVNAAFSGAITAIHPFLRDGQDDPITDDEFRFGDGVQIGVAAAVRHGITWGQLNTILRQLSGFMNGSVGARRQHMQELIFEISEGGNRVGEGFVLYRPDPPPLVNPKYTNETELLQARAAPLNISTVNAIPYKVPDSPVTLKFAFFGDLIPSPLVLAAFEGAYSKIVFSLGHHPSSGIILGRFDSSRLGVSITVLANRGTTMTWKQLSWVLGGLYGFMTGPPERSQRLTCEISISSRGIVGYASVWYDPPSSLQVAKRNVLNTTALSLPVANPGTIRYYIPDTLLVLLIKYSGVSIPEAELEATIRAAMDQINRSWVGHKEAPIPGNCFFCRHNGIRLSIFAKIPHVLSWDQVRSIVSGVYLFVTGVGEPEKNFRAFSFDVKDLETGMIAYGMLQYSLPRTVVS